MKIVCISDTHNERITIPDGDVLIHSGDATIQGTRAEAEAFADWWNDLPHKHKIFVAGNHDWLWQRSPSLANSIVPSLHEKTAEIDGLKIYGASWQPRFFDWAFNLSRGRDIAERWDLIPNDTDILITHSPPHGILDETRGQNVGCYDLLDAVKRVRPRLHVFGHIHSSYGQLEHCDTQFVNASICDEAYTPNRLPIVIEL
jgi:Icc-related predicted phosphoesterase